MTTPPQFDIVGIGNAIVDVVTESQAGFIESNGLQMGSMVLIDAARAVDLYARMGPAIEVSGGSCANTVAGASALGSRVAFIGKVAADALGDIFRHDLTSLGVHFDTPPAADSAPTARCLIFVTPDAQRTMATFLGASVELGPDDIDLDLVAAGRFVYLEGYSWDPPRSREALRAAIAAAHAAGRRVAMTLSDPYCVDRHRAEFRELVAGHIDILFANQLEAESLLEVGDVWDAVAGLQGRCGIVVITRGDQGSIVITPDDVHEVAPVHVEHVVDSTGAGDLYAAGFLHGLAAGWDLGRCARAASAAAAEVIGHFGARPERDLREIVRASFRQEGTT